MGPTAEDCFALKIRRLRRGANPRTWVPKTNTLALDNRSRKLRVRNVCNSRQIT